jgi:hypothetical protein
MSAEITSDVITPTMRARVRNALEYMRAFGEDTFPYDQSPPYKALEARLLIELVTVEGAKRWRFTTKAEALLKTFELAPLKGYAQGTEVPVERTRAEIDSVLTKNGASSVAIMNNEEAHIAAFAFTIKGARFRVELPLPARVDVMPATGKEPRGWHYLTAEKKNAWLDAQLAQARRQRWRQMLLLLKAKLEIVRMGLASIEHEFMADMVLPSGDTAGQVLAEVVRRGLTGVGDLPKLLGTGS